ncbi:MAG: cyclic pyranopterin monophosphate synthase MoaC [Polyangiaceae bacterium]
MVGTPTASAVFDFESILPQLDFLPIAARRALDHAGLRLSLEAWRSLSLDDRCILVAAGADDVVDAPAVTAVVRRATPPAQRIEVVGDPDPLAPPDALLRLPTDPSPLDARQWARLRALDRYALAHVHRRSIARNDPTLIQAAYEDIVTGHLRSLRPPADDRDRGSSMPPPVVPPPPPLPRTDATHRSPARHSARPRPRRSLPPVPRGAARRLSLPASIRPSMRAPLRPSPRSRLRSHPRLPAGPDPLLLLDPPVLPAPRFPRPQLLARALPRHTNAPYFQSPGLASPRPSSSPRTSPPPAGRMVDVGPKPVTERRAVAAASVRMARETFRRLSHRDTPKGDVLAVARVAGIQAAKRTSELIPLCHIVALTSVEVHMELDASACAVHITAVAQAADRTGVEMEAMVAASVAALTIYDMLKGIDREMTIDDVKLLEKSGGRTGHYQRREA